MSVLCHFNVLFNFPCHPSMQTFIGAWFIDAEVVPQKYVFIDPLICNLWRSLSGCGWWKSGETGRGRCRKFITEKTSVKQRDLEGCLVLKILWSCCCGRCRLGEKKLFCFRLYPLSLQSDVSHCLRKRRWWCLFSSSSVECWLWCVEGGQPLDDFSGGVVPFVVS